MSLNPNTNNVPVGQARKIYGRALAHHRANRLAEAIKDYTQAVRLSPQSAEIYNNLGVALRAAGQPEAAVACYRRSLAITPGSASVYTNLGNALRDLGAFTRAVEAHRRAVKHAPKSAKALFNAGRALNDVDETKTALDYFTRAIKLEPSFALAKREYAMALLRLGDWSHGFKALGVRVTISGLDPRRAKIPTWDGSSLQNKTILINFEDNENRVLQFMRFFPALKRMGATILVECPPHLNHLLNTLPYIDGTPNLGTPVQSVDVQIPLLSLPYRLNTTIQTLPGVNGYLPAPKLGGHVLSVHPQTRLAVGLVWSGGWAGRTVNKHANANPNANPSANPNPNDIKLDDCAELFGIPGIELYALELGPGTRDIARLGLQPIIEQTGPYIMDVADMAGIIDQLDLIICVDCVAAHIAGAMGKPVWMLTRPGADWSWLLVQDASPWYASMQLFRKAPTQAWTDVIRLIRQALMNVLKGTT